MQQGAAVWIVVLVVAALAAVVVAWLLWRPSNDALTGLREQLPEQALEWNAGEPATIYDPETIYSYIDGQAEVYLAYGMRGCLTRRFAGPPGESDVVLDLFEMASPADAFGVFTHDQDGEPAGVGQGSLLRYGWLSFWKGRYFGSIVAENETDRSVRAVLELGRAVAALIEDEGEPPAIVSDLPAEGREERSVRFLRDAQILSTHLGDPAGDAFGLDRATPAALASYRHGEARAHLLLVDYRDAAAAQAAREAFRARLKGFGPDDGPASIEDRGWYAVRLSGRRLAAVLGAGSEDLANALVARVPRDGFQRDERR